ncbi:MAG: thioredoxin family protein [Saprospiraceae bacterium]
MSLTDSNMLPLGTLAPDFELVDIISKKAIKLNDSKKYKATVVIFMCNHCPYVIHLIEGISELTKRYSSTDVRFIGINSNDITRYPEDAPDKMIEFAKENNFSFPYCFDESQEIAKSYDAACTPDFYVFNSDLLLSYRGRFDASRPNTSIPVTGQDLSQAINCLIKNQEVSELQYPSAGCNIKWK